MAEVRRVQPQSLDELKLCVENYAKSLSKNQINKSVAHIFKRAQCPSPFIKKIIKISPYIHYIYHQSFTIFTISEFLNLIHNFRAKGIQIH